MSLAHYGPDEVFAAVSAEAAIEAVRDGFVHYAKGDWQMPPKLYLTSPPHGDFRAMPAMGDGLAILKWVTSFPDNPKQGRPVVYGSILVNDSSTGEPLALVDGGAVTALRTGAAAAVASLVLARAGATTAGIIGCGLHGSWAARCLAAAGFSAGRCVDADPGAAERLASEMGWEVADRAGVLECDVVTLVTPGHEPVVDVDDLRPGMHINALGADGPGKAEMTIAAVIACEVFCDEWSQASHGGEITGAVEANRLLEADVGALGEVLSGGAGGRSSDDTTTLFDSTGLAIQDLALARLVLDAEPSGHL